MDKKELLLSGYEITGDEYFMKTLYPVPDELDSQLEDLYHLALKGKQSAVKKFIRLIEKYPKVPALKNFLSVLYSNMGKIEKSYEVNHWIVAEHPEYLFGKLNMAAELYLKNEYDKIPEVLGESMELKSLYPQRDTFHIVEASGFFKIAILYFSAIGDLEQAEIRLDVLKEIAPESEDLKTAEGTFNRAKTEAVFTETKEKAIEVTVNKSILTDVETPPEFTHKAIELLYENDFYIDNNIITEILELPRQSLINDLNKVLKDSIIRYNHFKTKADNEGFDDKNFSFVIHALLLLSEIEASESLANIFEILRQEEDYIELFIDDILTEYMWLVFYKMAASNLDACKKFMFEPGIYSFCKSSVSEMANQVVLHQPERRNEIVEWYRDIFRFFLNSNSNDNVIDSNLLGMMVNDVLDFKGVELLPEIEKLYKKEIVDLFACGDIDAVKKHLDDSESMNYKRDIISVFKMYDDIKSWGSDDSTADDIRDENIDIPGDMKPVNTGKKPGRNDPCPCGSGKKYKKCCMNK
ncbi:hypothetical protein MNBD_BACTEROID07-163 [hydrothermal vent metagenome]|uniref:Protein export cytoplasm protein SecA ATPase RNA helicase (TC 3.A.5.1.1) n=1 Tax=hydrothermal vent metagenome TaxID=652676 RepID=A0A3B0UMF9_9ZZZZ